jgi:hypothetical protein
MLESESGKFIAATDTLDPVASLDWAVVTCGLQTPCLSLGEGSEAELEALINELNASSLFRVLATLADDEGFQDGNEPMHLHLTLGNP